MQDAGADGVVVLLLGNKIDCEKERQVPTEAGQHLAQVSMGVPGRQSILGRPLWKGPADRGHSGLHKQEGSTCPFLTTAFGQSGGQLGHFCLLAI